MKKTFTLLVLTLIIAVSAYGQYVPGDVPIMVVNPVNPQVLVQDSLVSGCVEAFNVVYKGDTSLTQLDSTSIGYFKRNGSLSFPFESGIILATGHATNAVGPNNSGSSGGGLPGTSGDPDLTLLSGVPTYDATILEFDFIPSSDTLTFRYIFASEEYNEYVCATVNDVFGFFISGPGITGIFSGGAQNIAFVPGTTIPVSINTVNNGSIGSSGSTNNCPDPVYYLGNSAYYTDNTGGLSIQYDGLTVPMTATAIVIPCETYHIKLKIADGGDSVYDSGVFIETGSFTDGTSVSINNVNPAGTMNDLYEGCESFYVFSRTDTTDLSFPVVIQLAFSGTATMGSDITTFPTTITIPIGQISDTIYYTAFMDGINEPAETFIIEVLAGCPCNPEPASDTITIYNYVEFKGSITNTDSMYCGITAPATLDLVAVCISHPAWFIDFLWSTGETTETITIIPPTPGHSDVYWVAISDLCGNTLIDSIIVGVSNLSGLSLSTTNALCYNACNGIAQATPLGTNSNIDYIWSGPNIGTTTSSSIYTLCAGNYAVTVTDDSYCEFHQNFTITQPNAALDTSSGILPINTDYCNSPGQLTLTAFANIPNVTYSWNGAGASANTMTVSPASGQNVYWVKIQDFCGFAVYDTVIINVSNVENSNITYTDASCFGECDGYVEVLPFGIPPYTYQWTSNNSGFFVTNTNSVDSLCADTFSLNIIDAIGCTFYEDFEIIQPDFFDPALTGISVNDTMWCGVTPPSLVSLEGYSNLTDVNYLWSTGETNEGIFVSPQQGTALYTVTISDNCGNSTTDQVHIIVSNMAGINLTADSTSCFNSCDGAIQVVPQGGNTPFVFNWSPAASGTANSGLINNMCSGMYQVTVVDNGGCEFISPFEITSPPPLSECTITNTNIKFCGVAPPPSITLETSVNTGVSYLWNTGDVNNSLTFSPVTGANIYWVDFTDVCGNVHRDSIVISVSNLAGAYVIGTKTLCYGTCDGQISVTPINGITPYSFHWSIPNVAPTSTGNLSGVCAGTYSVSVYDQAQCLVVKPVTVGQPDSITFTIIQQNSNGANCDGYATATQVAGGTSPYTYTWSNPAGSTTYNVNNLCPGIYTVTVTDSKNCTTVDTVDIKNLYSIDEFSYNNLVKVFPNPNQDGNFTIKFESIATRIESIEIFDATGKLIFVEDFDKIIQETLQVKDVPIGIKLLRITLDDGESVLRKLIVTE